MPESKLMRDVGARLLQKREEKGFTQKQMAKMMGISKTHYGEIERGNKRLTVERLIQIHQILDADLTWLISGDRITQYFAADFMSRWNPEKEEVIIKLFGELKKIYSDQSAE